MQFLLRLLKGTFLLLNILAIVWLILCKWVSHHNTEGVPTWVSLLSFSNIFAVFANAFFVIFWLFSRKKLLSLLSLATLIICGNITKSVIGINISSSATPDQNGNLKVMSWNVHFFDLGEWTKDKSTQAQILKLIDDEKPDIVCLQEYYWDMEQPDEPYTRLIQQLGYPYIEYTADRILKKQLITSNAKTSDKIGVGQIIFSKYPIKQAKGFPISENNKMLVADISVNEKTYTIGVVHLTSSGIGRKERSYIQDLKTQQKELKIDEKSKSIFYKLRNSNAERVVLANRIDSLKRYMTNPTLIVGDFNDMPGSYVYQTIKSDFNDAFIDKGFGLGKTFRYIFPTLRIDYILYNNKELKAKEFEILKVNFSDHYPILAYFSIN